MLFFFFAPITYHRVTANVFLFFFFSCQLSGHLSCEAMLLGIKAWINGQSSNRFKACWRVRRCSSKRNTAFVSEAMMDSLPTFALGAHGWAGQFNAIALRVSQRYCYHQPTPQRCVILTQALLQYNWMRQTWVLDSSHTASCLSRITLFHYARKAFYTFACERYWEK